MTVILPDFEPAPSDDPFSGVEFEDEKPEPPAKRTRQRRASRVPTDGDEEPRTRQPRNQRLQDELLEAYVEVASDIGVAAPTVSGVLIVRAERTVDGMVSLASGHKRTMAALRKVAKVSKGADVIQTVVLVMVAAAIDFGRIPLDHPLLDNLGHVEIERDANGKPVRDERGKFVKNKMSLRQIHEQMTGIPEQGRSPENDPSYAMPVPPSYGGRHETGTGPIGVPPMNWSPSQGWPA